MVFDFEMNFVRDVIGLIDRRLARLERSDDGDADGSFDHANYLAGIGFAVLQTGLFHDHPTRIRRDPRPPIPRHPRVDRRRNTGRRGRRSVSYSSWTSLPS